MNRNINTEKQTQEAGTVLELREEGMELNNNYNINNIIHNNSSRNHSFVTDSKINNNRVPYLINTSTNEMTKSTSNNTIPYFFDNYNKSLSLTSSLRLSISESSLSSIGINNSLDRKIENSASASNIDSLTKEAGRTEPDHSQQLGHKRCFSNSSEQDKIGHPWRKAKISRITSAIDNDTSNSLDFPYSRQTSFALESPEINSIATLPLANTGITTHSSNNIVEPHEKMNKQRSKQEKEKHTLTADTCSRAQSKIKTEQTIREDKKRARSQSSDQDYCLRKKRKRAKSKNRHNKQDSMTLKKTLIKNHRTPPNQVTSASSDYNSNTLLTNKSYNNQGKPISTEQETSLQIRILPKRTCREIALTRIMNMKFTFPTGAYQLLAVENCPGVSVAIAPSRIPSAGLGLYMLMGPEEDGTALPGTRVATYAGKIFRSLEERNSVYSDQYKSDYVWEGTHPITREIVMVDGDVKLSYGPYINDGLIFKEPNTEIIIGNDGQLYVELTTIVEPNEELTLSYGSPFWMDPFKWPMLTYETQQAILLYYNCQPPEKYLNNLTSDNSLMSHRIAKIPEYLPGDISTTQSDNTFDHIMTDSTNAELDTLQQGLRSGIEETNRIEHRSLRTHGLPSFNGCHGTSSDGNTRISLQYIDENSATYQHIRKQMLDASREEAPRILSEMMEQSQTILINYWKKT